MLHAADLGSDDPVKDRDLFGAVKTAYLKAAPVRSRWRAWGNIPAGIRATAARRIGIGDVRGIMVMTMPLAGVRRLHRLTSRIIVYAG